MFSTSKKPMLGGPAQVGIDDEHVVAALRAGEGEVVERRRFALARAAADEGEGIRIAARFVEFHVRPQDAVGLRIGGVAGVS